MTSLGTSDSPLRVAIIGSGPAGFYAAEHLQKQADLHVDIDLFERLPTPYGLVRGGVAPDHPKIKSVTKVYDRIASKPNFRYYGNVEFGKHVTRADLEQHYHAIIYAVGAQSDRRLNIPGEDLAGSHPATEFVGWFNGHPDFRDLTFDLTQKRVAVIGVGNVAMDVARILARGYDELKTTDIADYALEALKHSQVEEIFVFGRRGPAQAAFSNPELKELGEIEYADIIVTPEQIQLDPYSQAYIAEGNDKQAIRKLDILTTYVELPIHHKPRRIILRFLQSPIEILGAERVEAIKLVKNELKPNEQGMLRPYATDEIETLPVGLVFRSVGYNGVALPDVPFYDRWGIIPNERGRVLTEHESGEPVIGHYVAGWIKRGPSGVIGTNKPDAVETVKHLIEDWETGNLLTPAQPTREAIETLIYDRQPDVVTFPDWQRLDQIETEAGEAEGRPRKKISRVDEMIRAIRESKLPKVGD